MKKHANEAFSAFLDGEASELDIQRLLKTLDENPEAYGQWHQLSVTQARLQGEVVSDAALAFHAQETVKAEAEPPARATRMLQLALTAGVAAMLVLTLSLVQWPSEVSATPAVEVSLSQQPVDPRLAQQQQMNQQRLTEYLKEHAERASFTTGRAIVPADVSLESEDFE